MASIDSRLPVDTSIEPILIKEEDVESLNKIKLLSDELNEVRTEIGRLFQIMSTLNERARESEESLRGVRSELLKNYKIPLNGKWVIDFNSRSIVKILDTIPNPV